MSRKARLVRSHPVDAAAGEEETLEKRVLRRLSDHVPAGSLELIEARLLRQQDHGPGWQHDSALVWPVRVHIDERRGQPAVPAGGGDRRDYFRESAAVVEMPMGEEDALDRRNVDTEAGRVLHPDRRVRPHVEQQTVLPIPATSRSKNGQAVARATALVEEHVSRMPTEFPRGGRALQEAADLPDLRHPRIDARERVCLVVDHDGQAQLVEGRDLFLAHGESVSLRGSALHPRTWLRILRGAAARWLSGCRLTALNEGGRFASKSRPQKPQLSTTRASN